MQKTAKFSNCRKYRYALYRIWDDKLLRAVFICLNPSTADETKDDPTIRKCVKYASDWGFGGICMVNLFGFRATDPNVMKAEFCPKAPDNGSFNDFWILEEAKAAGIVICAWGNDGSHLNRSKEVKSMLRGNGLKMCYLKMNGTGEPSHPLYLKSCLLPKEWEDAENK